MTESDQNGNGLLASARLVIIGILVVIVVPALALVIAAIGQSVSGERSEPEPAALSSSGQCVDLPPTDDSGHRRAVQPQQHGNCQCNLPELP